MPSHIFASFYPLEKQQSHRQESEACHTPKNSEMTHEFFSDQSNPCLKCQVRKTSKHVFGMVTLNGNSSSFKHCSNHKDVGRHFLSLGLNEPARIFWRHPQRNDLIRKAIEAQKQSPRNIVSNVIQKDRLHQNN